MEIWINKCSDEKPNEDFENAYIFSIHSNKKATIYSSIKDIWGKLSVNPISSIYEDLSIISLSIFGIDKRISRWSTEDKWTRDLKVSIPVINYEKWNKTQHIWKEALEFLTGDTWEINFRKTNEIYGNYSPRRRDKMDISKCNCVSLFSGGLDSFCGAIKLIDEGESVCFVGHNEYPKLGDKQKALKEDIEKAYPNQDIEFISFTANARAPIKGKELLKQGENTSRGRSLLFLGIGISIAGIIGEDIPLYIPENGFIGLNIPLTNNRKGTCSTRTTHPFFIKKFNEILENVQISNRVHNFFAFDTKREIVDKVKENEIFKRRVGETISCSHPCLPRWNKKGDRTYPRNCGYCYPCLIRKSSLFNADIDEVYSELDNQFIKFIMEQDPRKVKTNDLIALINSTYRYLEIDEKELKRLIKCTGPLTHDEIDKFYRVYSTSMEELIQLFSIDKDMKSYMGLNENE